MNNNLITSKEILEQAGISRATLNNYIKFGILPRPVVSRPGPDQEGVKQIGYFPIESLQWIKQVKKLKQQGKSMEEITELFQDKNWVEGLRVVQEVPADTDEEQKDVPGPRLKHRRRNEQKTLKVTIENLTSPAYLINNNLEIEWVNKQAEQVIFNQEINSIGDVESRNIFKFLFSPALHRNIKNWKELVGLHCTLLQRNMPGGDFAQTYTGITSDETTLLLKAYKNRQPLATDNLYHQPFSLNGKSPDSLGNFLVHSETYREGTLVVFVPADENSSSVINMLTQREKIIKELLDNRMPSMVSLCTLVASVQNLEKICTELLPCQYFQFINDLWQVASPVFDKYYGTYGRHAGNEMLYYFIKDHDDTYLLHSINCAMELRKVVNKFMSEFVLQKGLSHKLFLNIAVVHEGREYFGAIRSGGHVEFTALGTSVKVARQLSEFASNGEIWATKDLICKMPVEDRQELTFGVYRNQGKGMILQLDAFALPADLIATENGASMAFEPITNLAITEITERTSK